MVGALARLFSSDGFMPHGHCYLWKPGLVWLHVFSDGLTALAYTSIPFTLLYLVRKRRDIPFNWMLLCFGVFIVACGATHVMEIWTLWNPTYWLAGVVKAITAIASLATAALLVRLMPSALAIPAAGALARAHGDLKRAHDALEERVAERTRELTSKNEALANEIQERRRAEAALRLSEARFRRLAESGIVGVVTGDLDGTIIDANDTFAAMLGYTRDEIAAGKLRSQQITPVEWRDLDKLAVEQLTSVGVSAVREKEYVAKDGRRIPVLVGVALLEGSTRECVALVLDLSQQRRAESAIEELSKEREADARYRALLEAAPDAMVVVDVEGRITLVNVRTESLFGYARTELMGKQLELLIPERLRHNHARHLAAFFENPSARAMGSGLELFGRHKDGRELPIEVSLSPLRTPNGITVSAAIRDISERRQMEAGARLLADRLGSAVESIEEAFALFDDGDRLVLCNDAYRQLIGEGLPNLGDPIAGKPYQWLLEAWIGAIAFSEESQRSDFVRERLVLRRNGQSITSDVRLKDGRRLRLTERRTGEGGTVSTIWDLTDDVRLAEELREARSAAEAASRAKSEFLSSMSHELRTPLNGILGFAQLLERDAKEPLSKRHKERVSHILAGGEHLLRLIDDILDLTRIEVGNVAIAIDSVRVADVIESVLTTLEPTATRQGIRLERASLPDDLPLVAVDRTRFAQILMNLGSNAIKYNRPSGYVAFGVTRPAEGIVRITVRDTGIGIPADKQHKLFQPFQRAGQELGSIQGTGIGLVITKRLAQLMHGDVGFRSAFGQGSEFWVDVAVHESRSPTSEPPARRIEATRTDLRGGLILYVEDNPANVAFMRDLIGTFDNVDLLTASSAEEGIEVARERKPQVIIMDINLPGLSGVEALGSLRSAEETARIPVIALTAAASEHDKKLGIRAGFHQYLTKPVRVDELVAALDEVLFSEDAPRAT